MGHVRTKTTKRAARQVVERHYGKLTDDFQVNKRICAEIASIPSKRVRNKVAGYVTHLFIRLQKGPVRGVSLKLQEEERERKDNLVPLRSVLDQDELYVNREVYEMVTGLGFQDCKNIIARTHRRRD